MTLRPPHPMSQAGQQLQPYLHIIEELERKQADHDSQLQAAIVYGWRKAIEFAANADGVSKESSAAIIRANLLRNERIDLDIERRALLDIDPSARTPEQSSRIDRITELMLAIPLVFESHEDSRARAIIREAAEAIKP